MPVREKYTIIIFTGIIIIFNFKKFKMISLLNLFKLMEEKDASDIHLQCGSPPAFRIKGNLVKLEEYGKITEEELKEEIYKLLKEKEIKIFEERGTVDTSIGIPKVGRFRVSVFLQRGSISLVARRILSKIPEFSQLNLPPSILKITEFLNGLVLVTGPTGCGKSTTLAALINDINKKRSCHILCIEDPIEYLFKNEKAIITQREVGIDVPSFKEALKYAVRQDPDVILIGEIRDRESVEFGIQASETGHLVFGTLHSANATQTIERLLNFFPPNEHQQLRKILSLHLKAVVSQMLIPSCKEEIKLVPACEIMFVNSSIARLIEEGQDEKIQKAIKMGKEEGMQDFEDSLLELVNKGLITKETALKYAENPHSLEMKLRGIFLSEEGIIT
ncbi:MAG: type IV pili twitching motility protein PilT [Candidatus Omnitrophota bacterium]|nr:MAG: type IV pili twitching motility protein PilT [Candidatus Omnitrophota bacterium]